MISRGRLAPDKPGLAEQAWNTLRVAGTIPLERTLPSWPYSWIEALQRQRVRAIVRHAYATVPYYRETLPDLGLRPDDFRSAADLARLPLIDSALVAQDAERFVATPFLERGHDVFWTSGSTTGIRKRFYWDHTSLLLRTARGERDRVVMSRLAGETWCGVILREFLDTSRGRSLAAVLGMKMASHQRLLILPSDFSSRTQRAILSERTLVPRKPIHYNHLAPTVPLDVAATHLDRLRPRIILSFGSYADQFFRYLADSGRSIALPQLWVYLGDAISEEGRELAEQRFGCRLYSVYGAMEAGTIGFECERETGFHLNVDLCHVRITDDGGRDVPIGQTGEIVVSSLDNWAMVLLNYRIGDRGALRGDPCPCGRTLPVLERFEGRSSEVVRLADGRELSSLVLEALFRGELRHTLQAQIIQHGSGHFTWRVVPFSNVDRRVLHEAFRARAREVLGEQTSLEIEFADEIARTPAGKFLRAVGAPRVLDLAPLPRS